MSTTMEVNDVTIGTQGALKVRKHRTVMCWKDQLRVLVLVTPTLLAIGGASALVKRSEKHHGVPMSSEINVPVMMKQLDMQLRWTEWSNYEVVDAVRKLPPGTTAKANGLVRKNGLIYYERNRRKA